jgi:hypothetical protein
MSKTIKFADTVRRIAGPQLQPFEYKTITPPGWKGSGDVFLSKNIFNDIFGYIQFSRSPWVIPIADSTMSQRSFQVYLIRNKGEKPDTLLSKRGEKYTLLLPICYLLWDVLDIQKYNSRYYEWNYQDPSQLEVQINTIVGDLIQFGIPWLEDPNSRNPY